MTGREPISRRSTEQMVVRRARVTDVEDVVAFGAAVVPPHYTPILGAAGAAAQLNWWTTERMSGAIAASRVELATSGGVIVGVCETGEFDHEQVIWKLYVAPEARGRGIGVALIDSAIAALPTSATRVLLEHFAGNTRAAAFYEREGFRVMRTDASLSGDPAAAVVWRARDVR